MNERSLLSCVYVTHFRHDSLISLCDLLMLRFTVGKNSLRPGIISKYYVHLIVTSLMIALFSKREF